MRGNQIPGGGWAACEWFKDAHKMEGLENFHLIR